jgi:hypothetical protein
VDKSGEEDVARTSAAVDANIRVGVGLLDKLMDLVGELVLARNQILQFNIEREDPALKATSQRLNLITTELQEGVMKTRMQPIGVVCRASQAASPSSATSTEKSLSVSERLRNFPRGTSSSTTRILGPVEALARSGSPCSASAGEPAEGTSCHGSGLDVMRCTRRLQYV